MTGQPEAAVDAIAAVTAVMTGEAGPEPHRPKIYGELMTNLPRDLYIPPDALEIYLDAFEGPLDLLLYLIRKANVNIIDIPMTPLTAQYLAYVEAMRRKNLELAAEYLLMAAMLLEIKSRMLLPRPPKVVDGEPEDPRAELVRRLMEYERIKQAAAKLDDMPRANRDFEWVSVWINDEVAEKLPEVSLHDLQVVWLSLMKKAKVRAHHRIKREELSVREYMIDILRRLQGRGYVVFEDLFESTTGLAGLVVSFLAVLELARERLVEITQNEALAPIYIRTAQTDDHALQA